jgi:hypothetical protein
MNLSKKPKISSFFTIAELNTFEFTTSAVKILTLSSSNSKIY